ncbi:MAG: Ig-like domain-containing protein, partial [Candidatus Muirbacterium halophilum]|nr:Ig-like domain-containing protein [Candidatus Muirbacterium halophilum]
FDNNIFDFEPSHLDFNLSTYTEPTQLETAAKSVYYHFDYPSIAVTKESSVDVYYELINPNNPANTMEVEVYVYKEGDTPPPRNSDPAISTRFSNSADFGLVHKINVDIGGFLPQGGTESPLVNIELRFSEYAGTIEVANKIQHELDDMKHIIVYDPLPPKITNEYSKQLFVKWNDTLGLKKVNEDLNTNFPIYGPLKLLFEDQGTRQICLFKIDNAGLVEKANIKIYRKLQGGAKDYIPQAYYNLSVVKDRDSIEEVPKNLVLKVENWNHYFYPRTQYFIEFDKGPWDKAGNLIEADSRDIISNLKFQTDENPPVFAAEGLLDPLIDAEDVNIYGSIKLNFDEMIDTESFEKAFKLILDETGQEIKIMDYEFLYDTEEFVHRIRILPQDPLIYSKTYAININNNFKDVAGYSISGINYKFTTELDTTPPQQKAIYPFANQTGLPHSTGIYVQFDGRMDESTFTTNNLKLLRGTSPIPYSYIYETEGSNLYIFPNNRLIPNTTYTVNITTGLKDLSGNSLTSPISWSFKTIEQEENYANVSLTFVNGGIIPPVFPEVNPTYVDGHIELTFTKEMEHSELLKVSNYILYDGHRNIELTVQADLLEPYKKFILKSKKGTYGFSWYPENGYFYINREYKLYTLPFLKDRSGSYIIKSLIKSFKTEDTVKPRVLSTYPWGVPTDVQKIDISEKLDYARVYFDEEVIFNAAKDKEFYNIITDDITGAFPVSLDYTTLGGIPVSLSYDAVYYSEAIDNFDYNQDGYKDDYFLEIFDSSTDSADNKNIFPEGTYEIKVKLGPYSGYEIEDIQNNLLEAPYTMKFAISNLYGDLSLDTDWFSASPSIYDTAELKTKYTLKPEVKVVFTDKLVKNIDDFEKDKVKLAMYILADTNNNGIFADENPVYGDVSYDEVSVNEELKYVVTYKSLTALPQNTDCIFMVKSDAVNMTNINGAPLPADAFYPFETMDNPVIYSVFPQNEANEISVNTHVLVTFSEAILENSIDENSLYIIDSEEVKVNSKIYYEPVYNTARIVPVTSLTPNKDYFVVADKVWNAGISQYICIKDNFGNDIAFKEVFKFTTENKIDNVKPRILSTLPAKNTMNFPVRGGTFEVVFSELMDDTTLDGDNKTITPDDRKKFHLLYNYNDELFEIDDRYILPYYSDIDRKATFFAAEKNGIYTNEKIDFQLRNNTMYYLKVDNTVQDISGNNLDNTGTMIITEPSYAIRFKTVSDAVLPVVEKSYADVSSNSNILRIDFSEVLSYTKDFKGFFSIMYRPNVSSSWEPIPTSNFSVINSNKIILRDSIAPYYKQEITTATIIPGIIEFNNGFYRVLISNSNGTESLKDLSNNIFAGTVLDIEIKDDYIPYIVEKSPEGKGIPIIKEKSFVWMRFSEQMNE